MLVSIAVVALLFLLPKVVVENDNSISQSPSDSAVANINTHAQVAPETSSAIKNLRALWSANPGKEKNAIFADSLAGLYADAARFDSAAWFAEDASKFFNTTKSWIKAGNLYYKAYGFAVDQRKQADYALHAQSLYTKVLEKDPNNLEVKTNMAMTYLTHRCKPLEC